MLLSVPIGMLRAGCGIVTRPTVKKRKTEALRDPTKQIKPADGLSLAARKCFNGCSIAVRQKRGVSGSWARLASPEDL
jgi:hypothetical protein